MVPNVLRSGGCGGGGEGEGGGGVLPNAYVPPGGGGEGEGGGGEQVTLLQSTDAVEKSGGGDGGAVMPK